MDTPRVISLWVHAVGLGIGALVLFGLSIYDVVWHSNPFQSGSFGMALGAIAAGGGASAFGVDRAINMVNHARGSQKIDNPDA